MRIAWLLLTSGNTLLSKGQRRSILRDGSDAESEWRERDRAIDVAQYAYVAIFFFSLYFAMLGGTSSTLNALYEHTACNF